MAVGIDEFAVDLVQSVHARAMQAGILYADAFFEVLADHLVDAGEMDDAERAFFDSGRGMRVDGFGGDPRGSERKLTLIVTDPVPEAATANLTQTEMEKAFKRLQKFVEASLAGTIHELLDPSTEAWGLADLISARWREIETVRLLLLTNRPLSSRVDRKDAGEIQGVPVTYGVWDLTRLHRLIESGSERELLEISFLEEFGRGVPVLPADANDSGYQAYLAVVPGADLAAIYDRWGARLLEQNVRVFLQARSSVNKGIKATLENEPHMFLAYNNGITATAEDVTVEHTADGLSLTRVRNLQIVNGGQTTASIHRARRTSDLSKVFVQMKLSVIDPSTVEDVVPRISEYANSQNKVSQADFFSNHPFHIRIEKFSRQMWAPAADGQFVQTKWFYERARGQYLEAQAGMTASQKSEFKKTNPLHQKFTKTDLAKFANVWRGLPHIVSLGAQKNFANFAEHVAKFWGDKGEVTSGAGITERYFQHAIAKGIIFRRMEKLVSAAEWYEGGYRANIVAYAIAKLGHEFESAGLVPNLDDVWRRQVVPVDMERALDRIGQVVSDVLVMPPEGIANVTEWAKKPACWTRVKELKIDGLSLQKTGITPDEETRRQKEADGGGKLISGIEAQMLVVNAGGPFWQSLLDWGVQRKVISEKERGILQACARIPATVPSERQSTVAVQVLLRLTREEHCPLGLDVLKGTVFG